MRAARLLCLAAVALAGCATTTGRGEPPRVATPAELRALEQVIMPLVQLLEPPLPRGCPINVLVARSRSINAAVGLVSGKPGCRSLGLFVTEGSLYRLPPDMLRAILAHELGHVQLGHLEARRDRGATPAVLRPFTTPFERAQETEADAFAVGLLRQLEPSRPGACEALVYVLALLGGEPAGTGWLSAHPSAAGRAERVQAGCNAP